MDTVVYYALSVHLNAIKLRASLWNALYITPIPLTSIHLELGMERERQKALSWLIPYCRRSLLFHFPTFFAFFRSQGWVWSENQTDCESAAKPWAWGTGMNLSKCSPAGGGGVCLVKHLTLSTEGLGSCVCKGEGALWTKVFCSNLLPFNDGERNSSLSPVKKAGPAVDLVPELRTSYYLPFCVNFTINISPNLGRTFLAHSQEDVTHILRYTAGTMPCMYSTGHFGCKLSLPNIWE